MKADGRIQLLVRFGYDGTRFHGLQPQAGLPTAGGALRARLEEAAGERARALQFASRTDAGVHALDNAATAWFRGPLDVEAACRAIERPRDDGLARLRVTEVPRAVNARAGARGKRYRYRVVDNDVDEEHGGELDGRFAWHVAPSLRVEPMRAAARALVGEHDFASFRARNCAAKTTTKRLHSLRVGGPFPLDRGRNLYFLDFVGDAFLRRMVRIMAGTLIEVGAGWRDATDLDRVLVARRRQAAGMTAPARGLVLLQLGFVWPADGSGLLPQLSASPGPFSEADEEV